MEREKGLLLLAGRLLAQVRVHSMRCTRWQRPAAATCASRVCARTVCTQPGAWHGAVPGAGALCGGKAGRM